MPNNNSKFRITQSAFMRWVTHGIKRGRFDMSPRATLAVFTFIVGMALTAVLYLMLVSRTAARGRHIEQMRADLFRLQRENEQLEVDIAWAGSVSRLRERAVDLGFEPAKRIEFLSLSTSD